jgi:hypothetical protein
MLIFPIKLEPPAEAGIVPEIVYDLRTTVASKTDRIGANGLLTAAVLIVLLQAAATVSPAVAALIWGSQAVMIAVSAWLTWRRMGMIWMAFAAVIAAIGLGGIAVLSATGLTMGQIARRWPIASFWCAASIPVLVLASQWFEAKQWRDWHAHAAHVRFRDMFLFRHIPDLRCGRT